MQQTQSKNYYRSRTPRLTLSEVAALLGQIGRERLTAARDRALLVTCLATGWRIGAVLTLRVGDVAKLRLPAEVLAEVLAYATWRGLPAEAYLWSPLRPGTARAGRPIRTAQVLGMLRRRLELAGVEDPDRYSTESLRGVLLP